MTATKEPNSSSTNHTQNEEPVTDKAEEARIAAELFAKDSLDDISSWMCSCGTENDMEVDSCLSCALPQVIWPQRPSEFHSPLLFRS